MLRPDRQPLQEDLLHHLGELIEEMEEDLPNGRFDLHGQAACRQQQEGQLGQSDHCRRQSVSARVGSHEYVRCCEHQ